MKENGKHKKNKIKVGWFTFTCCEGCAIIFLELLNDHFKEWYEAIEFTHFKTLKSKNIFDKFDLAIVEGAISTKQDLDLLNKIRENSKYVMAVGSCAITGMPAGLRNNFSDKQKIEINEILRKFDYLERVEPVSKFIKVDISVPGCPMNEDKFVEELSLFIRKFRNKNKE